MTLWLRLTNASRWMLGAVIVSALAYAIGRVGLDQSMIRTLLFSALLLVALGLSVKNAASSMFFLILYVPFLGLLRRLLIPVAGWGSFDPLVILEPVVVLLLGSYWFYRTYFLREPIANDTRTFKLLRWMILVDILEVVNPKQGGLTVGYGGLIFYVVPLFWMILSRQYFNEKWIRGVVNASFIIGILAGLYGLKQTYWGYYPFEIDWIHLANIVSMNVGKDVRAVSVMTNAQEYALYLGVAMMVGWYYVLRGEWASKILGLVGNGVMGWALFMESTRGGVITTLVGIAVMTLMNARKVLSRITCFVVLGGILTAAFIGLGHMHSNNGLIAHEVTGLSNPLNAKNSTLTVHTARMWSGIIQGIKTPVGYGLGSTTTAATKFSTDNAGTEVDISNMFVSDGMIGGVLYLCLMATVVYQAFRQAHQGSRLGLIAVGVLCATGGQWINGELYSVAALVWVIIGQLDKASVQEHRLNRRKEGW